MRTSRQTYIAGQWLDPADEQSIDVIDPATARRMRGSASAA